LKRTDFIKKIIGLFGIGALPAGLLLSYRKIYLLQCFIRGFRFYEGPGLLQSMRTGDLLELVREPDNAHDACAIALHYNNQKIGYIPAEENELLSRLMDADVAELLAEITHLEPAAAAWENVRIAVYVLKKEDEVPEDAHYMTTLDTPRYHTLKHDKDKLSRFASNGKDILNGDDFYDALVENSENDSVYDLIHHDIGTAATMETIVNESLLVVNREKLPTDLQADTVTQAFEEGMVALDQAFDEQGYVVAQVNRVAELSARIEHFVSVKDKKGGLFWEVRFKPITKNKSLKI